MRNLRIIIAILSTIIFFSCNQKGDKFVGTWKNEYQQLEIKRNGENLVLEIISGTNKGDKYSLSYVNEDKIEVKVGFQTVDIIFDNRSHHLVYNNGPEFEKVK